MWAQGKNPEETIPFSTEVSHKILHFQLLEMNSMKDLKNSYQLKTIHAHIKAHSPQSTSAGPAGRAGGLPSPGTSWAHLPAASVTFHGLLLVQVDPQLTIGFPGGLRKQIVYQHTLINTTSNEICSVANTKAQILWLGIAGATGWVFIWITEAFTHRVRFYGKALCPRKTLHVSCQPYVGYGFKVSMIFFLVWDKKIWLPEQYPQPISFSSLFLMNAVFFTY